MTTVFELAEQSHAVHCFGIEELLSAGVVLVVRERPSEQPVVEYRQSEGDQQEA